MTTKISVLLRRILQIRKAVFAYSIASLIDIVVISSISILYEKISSAKGNDLPLLALVGIVLIIIRTAASLFLRSYSYVELMAKKSRDEYELIKIFIQKRSLTLPANENSLISQFKESITNATQLATINFDLPVAILISDLLFAIGGILLLAYNVGLTLILAITPVIFALLFFMKSIANRLQTLSLDVMSAAEERFAFLDNISETSLELCFARSDTNAAVYFDTPNNRFNRLIGRQFSISNYVQLSVEVAAFVIILLCLVLITLDFIPITLGKGAASFAVLARLVPSITRSIASATQLHYGIPAVIKLSTLTQSNVSSYKH